MLRLFRDNYLFYSFNDSENEATDIITSLKLKKEINALSSLTFTCYINHRHINSIILKRTCFSLIDTNNNVSRCLFIGKVQSIKYNYMSGTVDIECEDLLGCLRDCCTLDTDYDQNDPKPRKYRVYFDKAIHGFDRDNYHLEGAFGYNTIMNIPLPSVVFPSPNDPKLDEYAKDDVKFNDYLSLIYDTVLSYTGGIITTTANVVVDSQLLWMDINSYVISYRIDMRDKLRDTEGEYDITGIDQAHLNNVDFKYGDNILSVSREPSQQDIITAIYPYGTIKDKTNNSEEYIDLQGANLTFAEPYIVNNAAVHKYGYIAVPIDFGLVDTFDGISESKKDQAARHLVGISEGWGMTHIQLFSDKYTINGIDKYFYGQSSYGRPIDICDLVHIDIKNLAGSSNDIFDYCLSLDIDFFNHENDQYIIGPYIPDNILKYDTGVIVDKNEKKKKNKKRKK